MRRLAILGVAALLAVSCTPVDPVSHRVVREVEVASVHEAPEPAPTPLPILAIPYRVDVRVADGDDFGPLLAETMADPRGWIRAHVRLYEDPSAPYVVVLAEGDEVDHLCLPYRTGGRFSCQNGPVVAINADRWRHGVPHWPGDLLSYRQMLLNHEMGHLFGQRHLPCTPGQPAPVMYQQSGGLAGCGANPWPLDDEIEIALRRDQPIAPGYGE